MGFLVGLAGAGRMGRTHLAALSGSSEVAVAGVVEPYPSPALSVAEATRCASIAEAAFHQALRLQAEDFARVVRTGQGSGARPADAIAALKAAEWSSSK